MIWIRPAVSTMTTPSGADSRSPRNLASEPSSCLGLVTVTLVGSYHTPRRGLLLGQGRSSCADKQYRHAACGQHRASDTAQPRTPNSSAAVRGHDDQVCTAGNLGHRDACRGITYANVKRNVEIGALLLELALNPAQVVEGF